VFQVEPPAQFFEQALLKLSQRPARVVPGGIEYQVYELTPA
jgi:hypothetical protein